MVGAAAFRPPTGDGSLKAAAPLHGRERNLVGHRPDQNVLQERQHFERRVTEEKYPSTVIVGGARCGGMLWVGFNDVPRSSAIRTRCTYRSNDRSHGDSCIDHGHRATQTAHVLMLIVSGQPLAAVRKV